MSYSRKEQAGRKTRAVAEKAYFPQKDLSMPLSAERCLDRHADRLNRGSLLLLPRTTRYEENQDSHAEPSVGARR